MSEPQQKVNWPFVLPDGQKIYAHLYYAFNDVDEVTKGDFSLSDGFGSLQSPNIIAFCLIARHGVSAEDVSYNPDDLGAYPYVILSGQQYIDKITSLVTDGNLSDFGKWSTK